MRRTSLTHAKATAIRRSLTPAQEEATRVWATAVSNLWGAVEGLQGIEDLAGTGDIPGALPGYWSDLAGNAAWMIPALQLFLQRLESEMPLAVEAACLLNGVYTADDDPEGEETDADTPHLTA